MKVVDLQALTKERGLIGYSKLRKAELITFLQNNLRPTPAPRPRPRHPTRPFPLPPQSVRFRQDRPQEMDTFEQQEMSKSRPKVKNKLKDWYEWLVNHVPEPSKDKASRVFKTFKDKIMGSYK